MESGVDLQRANAYLSLQAILSVPGAVRTRLPRGREFATYDVYADRAKQMLHYVRKKNIFPI